MSEITHAAIALLEARRNVLNAEARALIVREKYAEVEEAYVKTHGELPIHNVVIENIAIVPHSDWYDCKPGQRFNFLIVDVLTEGNR